MCVNNKLRLPHSSLCLPLWSPREFFQGCPPLHGSLAQQPQLGAFTPNKRPLPPILPPPAPLGPRLRARAAAVLASVSCQVLAGRVGDRGGVVSPCLARRELWEGGCGASVRSTGPYSDTGSGLFAPQLPHLSFHRDNTPAQALSAPLNLSKAHDHLPFARDRAGCAVWRPLRASYATVHQEHSSPCY